MHVRKRNGALEPVNLNKIVNSLERVCGDLAGVDIYRIASKTVGGLVDGVSTRELDCLSIRTAKDLIHEEPVYSRLAARILANVISKEVGGQDIHSFSQAIDLGFHQELIGEATHRLVLSNRRKLNAAIRHERDWLLEYHGIQTLYDRYLLKHRTLIAAEDGGRQQRAVIETPQYFFMRVACGLANSAAEAIELYNIMSALEYMPSTPTLFNSGTTRSQMSSCYLAPSPLDSLEDLYKRYSDIAKLSKFAGGIGVAMSNVRGREAPIKGTNGRSNGVVPWLHTLSSSVAAVNQCLHPQTQVFTIDGLKPISTIEAGKDRVLGISGYYRPVEEVLRYTATTERSVAITVRHGSQPIPLTIGHPIYALPGVKIGLDHTWIMRALDDGRLMPSWVEAGELNVGDYIGTPVPKMIEPVVDFGANEAYFYGLMLGNGHISRKSNCNSAEGGFSYNPSTDADDGAWVETYLTARGVHTWLYERDNHYAQIKWTISAATPFSYDDLYDVDGRKRIAARFNHLPHDITVRLIEGLIATDGCISRGTEITFTNVSAPLIEGLRYQLIRLSVMSGMQTRHRSGNRILVREDGSESELCYDNDYSDVRVPAFPELAEALDIPAVTKRHWLSYGGMVWSRVKKVETIETPAEVYDLRVEFDETYTVLGGLVHNGGKRKGAACAYLEPHHPDIMQFLELRDQTGEKEARAYNLNLANWIPDLFMRRVRDDALWSLFDPTVAPDLTDLYGEDYEARYLELEAEQRFAAQLPARKIYARMMRTLAETGNGWMCFKDTANRRGNQVGEGGMIHLSNLCFAPDTLVRARIDGREIQVELKALCDYFAIGTPIEVLTLNEQTDTMEWKPVINAGLTDPDAEVLEIETPDGRVVRCTEAQPLLTQRGWVPAGELVEQDELVTVADQTGETPVISVWRDDVATITHILHSHLYANAPHAFAAW